MRQRPKLSLACWMVAVALWGAAPVLAGEGAWHSVTVTSGIYNFWTSPILKFDMVARSRGEWAMLWSNAGDGAQYFSLSQGDTWLPPVLLSSYRNDYQKPFHLATDPGDGLHLWLRTNDTSSLYGIYTGEGWSFESFPGQTDVLALAVGPSNTVGAVSVDYSHLSHHVHYHQRVSSGTWAKEEIMSDNTNSPICCSLAIGPGSVPYVGLALGAFGGKVYRRTSLGWEVFATFPLSSGVPDLEFDSLGRLHVAQGPNRLPLEISYRLYNHDGILIQTSTFPASNSAGYADLAVDENNNAHIAGSEIYINVQTGNTDPLPGDDVSAPIIAIVRGSIPGILRYNHGLNTQSLTFNVRIPGIESPPSSPLLEGRQTTDSIHWEWPAPPAGVLNVRLRRLSDGQPLSGLLPATSGSVLEMGLDPNSSHQSYLEVVFPGVSTVSAPSASVFTLANVPKDLSIFAPSPSTQALSWSRNNNPSNTAHRLNFFSLDGTVQYYDTKETNFTTPFAPAAPTAVTLSALNASGIETPMSVLVSYDESAMTYDLLNGNRVAMAVGGAGSLFLLTAIPETNLPFGAPAGDGFRATGVGFRIPTRQTAAPGQSVSVSFVYSTSTLPGEDPAKLVLARYDETRTVWIPLPTLSDAGDRRLSATTGKFGVFQVYSRDRPPETLSGVGFFPNPYRVGRGYFSVVEVPAGSRVTVRSAFGRMVREMAAGENGTVQWDGRDEEGRVVPGGVYSVRVGGSGEEKTFRLMVEK